MEGMVRAWDEVQIPEWNYFRQLLETRFGSEVKKAPRIILFGTDFPAELILAVTGQVPFWVTGGSRDLQEYSDDLVPRDTDPATRAALGELIANEDWKGTALVVVPCSSDAQRKTADLLQNLGWKVVTVWIPAKKDALSHKVFLGELEHAVDVICRHVRKRYSPFSLKKAVKCFQELRQSYEEFVDTIQQKEAAVSGIVPVAVRNSFFMMEDPCEWQRNLQELTRAIFMMSAEKSTRPRVLVVGSPIVFPNYKMLQLLYESELEICTCIDCNTGFFDSKTDSKKKGLEGLAYSYLEQDSSSAFVQNDFLLERLKKEVLRYQPDGIIWHVLKGQIEYDFELNYCEEYLEQADLPMIRLETDYQYQDIEQLRIRMEAFAELLAQKRKESTL